jgi:formylmethanofuran dehydrogenase subunit E
MGQTYQSYHKEYRQRPEAKQKRKEYQKKYKKEYRQRPEVKERRRKAKIKDGKKWREKPETKQMMKAHGILNREIKKGNIIRGSCEVCDEPDANGHHDDYDKPLEVRWLCDEHHQGHHNGINP